MAWWVYAGFLVANYIYHRATAKSPERPKPASEVGIPKIDEGSNVPIVYGRCRVRSPVLAWTSEVKSVTTAFGFNYRMNMLMILGIPFETPFARLWNIWVGDYKLTWVTAPGAGGETDHSAGSPPDDGSGPPGYYSTYVNTGDAADPENMGAVGGQIQLYDGRATQQHVVIGSPGGVTFLGRDMKYFGVNEAVIPGFRGYLSVAHFELVSSDNRWSVGNSPNLGAYSYEVSSYLGGAEPGISIHAYNVGLEANPATVLYDILTAKFGKLAIPTSKIDSASFLSAKVRLQEEGNGYSRAIDAGAEASEIIREILEQIDGVLYEDPSDGLIKIKLIRGDYDPAALKHVTVSNCEGLQNFAAGGWEGIVNKVRVVFTNRARDYQESSATAHSQATAASQDGETREVVLRMPGVCTQELANTLAARELAARSRPIAKCTAVVSREFYRVCPGDAVKVTWPEYGVDGRVFRVAAVSRGTLANGRIRLDLIEDFFYSWRGAVLPGSPFEPFPGEIEPTFEVS